MVNKNQKLISVTLAAFSFVTIILLSGCQNQPSAGLIDSKDNPTPIVKTENQIQIAPESQYSATDKANYQSALELKDASYCNKISDKNYQQICRDDLADEATLQQALDKNDAALCDKLSSQDHIQACKITIETSRKRVQQQKDQESNIQNMQKLRDEIVSNGDPARCPEIQDNNFRSVCELQILSNKALQTKDPSWCDKASSNELKAKCKEIVKL